MQLRRARRHQFLQHVLSDHWPGPSRGSNVPDDGIDRHETGLSNASDVRAEEAPHPSGICWFWGDKKSKPEPLWAGLCWGERDAGGQVTRRIPCRREGPWDCQCPALGRVAPRCRECPGAQTHLGAEPHSPSIHVGWGGGSPVWGKRKSPPPWTPRHPAGRTPGPLRLTEPEHLGVDGASFSVPTIWRRPYSRSAPSWLCAPHTIQ